MTETSSTNPPVYCIDKKTLNLLEETSPLHAIVAKRCLSDGRWVLIDTPKKVSL